MLQAIREHAQGWFAWVLVLLVGSTFAFWGVGNYLTPENESHYAAKVEGEGILKADLDRHLQRLRAQQVLNDEAKQKEEALSQLIDSKLLYQAALRSGFWVSDEQLNTMIVNLPAFQEKGKFSPTVYEQRLRSVGFTDESFRQNLRADLTISQLQNGLMASYVVQPSELNAVRRLINQSRQVKILELDLKPFASNVPVTDLDIEKAYEAHKSEFMMPELVILEYVSLKASDLLSEVSISDDEVKQYYDNNQAEFMLPREVRVAHILIPAAKSNEEDADKKAFEQANMVLENAKSGTPFDVLAKKYSSDPASAKNGGDIGWIVSGEMEAEFEKTAFALEKKNAISGIVKSAYGYHILKLLDEKPSKLQSFEEVKSVIFSKLQKEAAEALKAEKLEKMSTLAYEQGDSLQPVADALKLPIHVTRPFGRQGSPDGIAENPKVAQIAFSDDLLIDTHNSDVIDLNNNESVVFRVKTHVPPAQRSLEEVKPELVAQLESDIMHEAAKKLGNAWVQKLNAGESIEAEVAAKHFTWQTKSLTRDDHNIDRKLVEAIFKAPKPNLESNKKENRLKYEAISLNNQHYAIFALESVQDVSPKDSKAAQEEIKQFKEGLLRTELELELGAILNTVKEKADIKYFK